MVEKIIQPDVSVIIAAFNVERYIESAIDSALSQLSPNSEVIIVDDASTDDTVERIKRNNDPRIKLTCRLTNGGPSLARNEGLRLCTKSWVAILDGDDAFMTGRLARCISTATRLDADIVVDNLMIYNETTGIQKPMFGPQHFPKNGILTLAAFIKGNSSFLGGVSLGYLKPIMSRDFLIRNHIEYKTDIKIGEDYILLAEALASSARCIIERNAGYRYTVRNDSISHRLTLKDIQSMQNADKNFAIGFKLDGLCKKALKKRDFSLWEAYYFAQLVSAIKQKHIAQIGKIILRRPTAVLHLWEPIWKRVAFSQKGKIRVHVKDSKSVG